VLSAIAAAPGVAGTPAASSLNTLASDIGSGSLSATNLEYTILELQSLSGLPAPLSTLVSGLISQLSGAGSIFGSVPGLSSTQVLQALSELTALSAATPSTSLPSLPGIGDVLDALVLTKLSGSAPSSSSGAALGGLGSQLTADGKAATPASSSSTTSGTTGTGTGTTKTVIFAYGIVDKASRSQNKVTTTLYCLASPGKTCSSTVRLTGKGLHSWKKTVRIKQGKTDRFTVSLKRAGKSKKRAKRVPIKLAVRSGAYAKIVTLK
jgi:hypothetical protein